jgi:hypothetical protein
MTEYEEWLAANDGFLAEAIQWLRGRLGELERAGEPPARATATPPPGPERSLWGRGRKGYQAGAAGADAVAADRVVLDGMPPAVVDAEALDEPPPLVLLARRLGLSTFERNVLLLAVAVELDTRIAELCARAQHDPGMPFPTFALALTLFDGPSWDVMSPERPLRHWQLVEVLRPASEPLTVSRLRADDRVVSYVKGLNYIDERLRPMLHGVRVPDAAELSTTQHDTAGSIVAWLDLAASDSLAPTVQLLGADGISKRLVAAKAASDLGLHLLELSADDLNTTGVDLEQLARLWHRESLLSPVSLYLNAADADRQAGLPGSLRRWVGAGPGVTFVDVREPWPEVGGPSSIIDVARPTASEQREAWQCALQSQSESIPAVLAGHFDFNLPAIDRLVRNATASVSAGEGDSFAQLWQACLAESRPGLDQLAQRIDAKATWGDIKLPETEQLLLRGIAEQVAYRGTVYDTFGFRQRMNRGLGISVLFTGESGTGKTMAAEVLANALNLMLYRVDLSAVVSKYIGETEKNLRRLFDAADGGGAILFFDEADALFGKRSEVKDSHDRYANIEINYLLQRIEAYRGLAILATNHKSAMDTAFLRRLRFIVTFPFPGAVERAAIWADVLPPATPRGDIDVDRLARLNVTGGSIHNIALNAAFAAASSGGVVTMPLLLDAARSEFRKLDKPIKEADFAWLEPAGGSR